MILVVGTPDSGKSAFAEKLSAEQGGGKKMAYIATMIPFGEEGKQRVEKHRKLREGKNFVTFEEPYCVSGLKDVLKDHGLETALLECVSNLSGNVMHMPENMNKPKEQLVDAVVKDIMALSQGVKELIVVANEFELQDGFDRDTIRYVQINHEINERLKAFSSRVAVKENGVWEVYENH